MIAIIRNSGDIRVIEGIQMFSYTAADNKIGLWIENEEERTTIDCKTNTVELMQGLGGYPEYSFLSDPDKEAKAAKKKASAGKSDLCEDLTAKSHSQDPLESLEYRIREWCMKNGYGGDEEEWFTVYIVSTYKKKVLTVKILSSNETTAPKRSVFEGENTSLMFGKALAFYTGGCA